MTTADELLANAERYAATFDKGDLPLPPAKHVDPFIPVKDSVRGFIYDVTTGKLAEIPLPGNPTAVEGQAHG